MKRLFTSFFILLTATGLWAQKKYNGSNLTVGGNIVSVSQLNITDSGTITDIDVKITFSMSTTQAYEYLNLSLISPSGTSVKLIKKGSLKGDTYQMILTDEHNQGISDKSPPYSENIRPDNPLYHIDGESISGDWELVVSNLQGFTGTVEWELWIKTDSSTPLSAPNFGTEYAGSQITIAGDATSVGNLTIAGDIDITDLNIKFNVSMTDYQAFQYLRVMLKSGQITYYPFAEGHFAGNMYRTIIDDEAIQKKSTSDDWSSPHLGTHQSPNSPLDSFDGLKASNDWELIVTNSQGFTGTLDWSLLVNSPLKRPTVTISTSESSPTDKTLIPVTITFSEYVNDFEVSDTSESLISVSNGFFHELLGSGTTYNGLISPTTLNGNISIDIAENVAISKANYGNQAATQFNIIYRKELIAPAAPTGLTGAYGYKQVDLSWNKNSETDVAKYYIYQGSPGVLVDSTTTLYTSTTISNLTNGNEYLFRVKAVDIFGNLSDYSNQISITPRALLKVPSVFNPISTAINAAESGDTILISEGNYEGHYNLFSLQGNQIPNPLTIASDFIIDGDTSHVGKTVLTSNNSTATIYMQSNQTVNLIGITFKGGNAGIFANGGNRTINLNVENCQFRSINTPDSNADRADGPLYFSGKGTLVVKNSHFENNQSNRFSSSAGIVTYGKTEILDCSFINNHARAHGAIRAQLPDNNITIKRSSFINNSGNTTNGEAGAILLNSYTNNSSNVPNNIIENCLFVGNKANHGGAIYISGDGNLLINHVTAVNNTSGSSGSGGFIYNTFNNSSKIEITNSILWGEDGSDIYSGVVNLKSLSYSIVKEGFSGFNLQEARGTINSDPRFLDTTLFDYSLSNYSPAIGAGNFSDVTDDLLGKKRPNPTSSAPDIGAYENALANKNTKPQIVLDTIFEGTELYIGRSYPISWKKYDDQSTDYLKVDISYSNDSGTTWESSQSDISSNSISWEVPNIPSASKAGQIRLTVKDADQEQDVVIIKDLTFLINYPKFSISSPSAGSIMKISDKINIIWETDPDPKVEKLDIYYSIDSGSNWKEIVKDYSDIGLLAWDIPNETSTNVKLRIVAKEQYGYADTVEVENLKIEIAYPKIIASNPPTEFIWSTTDSLNFEFDILVDPLTINKSNILVTNSADDYQYDVGVADKNVYVKFDKGLYTRDEITITFDSKNITTNYGYQLDGNGDGTPGDNYVVNKKVYLPIDYDSSGTVNSSDILLFVNHFKTNNLKWETAPVIDGTVPYVKILPDGKYDIDDMLTFVQFGNWYLQGASGKVADDIGHTPISLDTTIQSKDYVVALADLTKAVELYVKYDPTKLKPILEPTSGEVKLGHHDGEKGVISLILYNPNDNEIRLYWEHLDTEAESDISVLTKTTDFNDQVTVKHSMLKVINVPNDFALHDNYPNPFNPTTTFKFDVPELSDITISIYNLLGQKVKTFNMQNTPAGYHSISWNAINDYGDPVGAGIYFYQLQANQFLKTKKMVLLK